MISLKTVKSYCKDFEKIENYDKAIADTTQTWECHHRLEEFVSVDWLKKHNDYYNVSPNELIFLTSSEHMRIHHQGNKNPMYGKVTKGYTGKRHSDETKKKMSECRKNKPKSEEHKRKIAEASKGHKRSNGRHWYNNGTISKFCYECPPGFVPGRL